MFDYYLTLEYASEGESSMTAQNAIHKVISVNIKQAKTCVQKV